MIIMIIMVIMVIMDTNVKSTILLIMIIMFHRRKISELESNKQKKTRPNRLHVYPHPTSVGAGTSLKGLLYSGVGSPPWIGTFVHRQFR